MKTFITIATLLVLGTGAGMAVVNETSTDLPTEIRDEGADEAVSPSPTDSVDTALQNEMFKAQLNQGLVRAEQLVTKNTQTLQSLDGGRLNVLASIDAGQAEYQRYEEEKGQSLDVLRRSLKSIIFEQGEVARDIDETNANILEEQRKVEENKILIAAKKKAIDSLSAECQSLERRLGSRRSTLQSLETSLSKLRSEVTALENQVRSSERRVKVLRAGIVRLTKENKRLRKMQEESKSGGSGSRKKSLIEKATDTVKDIGRKADPSGWKF